MKAAIAVLSVVFVVLLALLALAIFGGQEDAPESPTVLPSVSQTAEPSTEPPATQPTTEQPTTQPPTEPLKAERGLVLAGREVALWEYEGAHYLERTEFAEATGLTAQDAVLTGPVDTVEIAEDHLTVNGETVDAAPLFARETVYLPYPALTDALKYPAYTDEESGVTYLTPAARPFELPENVNVPVLMYHAVSDEIWGVAELFVSPTDLEAQLSYLVEHDFDPIWFEDLAHVQDYDKPVILTFDDGYDDNYLELLPLLRKYQVKATVFVIGDAAGMQHKMTEEQIREMADSGLVSIQSHGYTHGDMDVMDEQTLEYELSESKRVITRMTGRIPYVLCYPTGRYSDLTLEVAARHYLFGIKMNGLQYNTSDDPLLVNRYYISRYTDLGTFASYLDQAGT